MNHSNYAIDSIHANGQTRVTGIIGWPVGHSLSPSLHNAAYVALKLDFAYLPFPVAPGELAAAMAGARALGIVGLNVTIPHKVAVAAYLDALTDEARLAGAVNTVVRQDDGTLLGHNTDGAGFLAALTTLERFEATGKTVVVLGAGGAARAIVARLTADGARTVRVSNRAPARAHALREHLLACAKATALSVIGVDEAALREAFRDADLLVNCTSVGMHDEAFVPELPLEALPAHAIVSDVVYRPGGQTPLVRSALALGLRAHAGLGMLVHQAALAQRAWTGVDAPVEVMFEAARAAQRDRERSNG